MTCFHCGEPFIEGEAQLTLSLLAGVMPERESRAITAHRECMIRMAVGSVGHQMGTCHCYGFEGDGDPPHLTLRQAALAAVEYSLKSMKRPPVLA